MNLSIWDLLNRLGFNPRLGRDFRGEFFEPIEGISSPGKLPLRYFVQVDPSAPKTPIYVRAHLQALFF